jgi:hypothetical protein
MKIKVPVLSQEESLTVRPAARNLEEMKSRIETMRKEAWAMRAGGWGAVEKAKRVFLSGRVLWLSFLLWSGVWSLAFVTAQDFENWFKAASPKSTVGQTSSSLLQARSAISGKQQSPERNGLEKQTSETLKTVGTDRLAQQVTLDTASSLQSPRNVPEILTQLHEMTGVDFLVTCGEVPAQTLRFDKIPLRKALDALLLPSNLTWEEQGGVVLVKREKIEEQAIRLTDAEVQIFKAFEKKRWFERQIFSSLPKNAPAPSFGVDEQQGVLRLTAGKAWIGALERFLETLRQSGNPDLSGLSILLTLPGEAESIRRELEDVEAQDYPATAGAKRIFRTGGDYLVLEPAFCAFSKTGEGVFPDAGTGASPGARSSRHA